MIEQRTKLPAGLLSAVARVESNFNPRAVNKKSGATGLFQFMPETAASLGFDPRDAKESALGAGVYLAHLLQQFGSLPMALAAYNWGPGNLAKYGAQKAPAETVDYVRTIMAEMGGAH